MRITTCPFCAALAFLLLGGGAPGQGSAQTNSEHTGHHPGAPNPPSRGALPKKGGMTTVQGRASPSDGGVASMMDSMMGGSEHGSPPLQLYPTLMAMSQISPAERHRLRTDADARVATGLAIVREATASASAAVSPEQSAEASQRLREGLGLYESGSSARLALSGRAQPQAVALDWFRDGMRLPSPPADQNTDPIFGAVHLFFMTLLLMVAGGLITLQVLRLRRVKQLVAALRGATTRTILPARSGTPSIEPPAVTAKQAVEPSLAPSNAPAAGAAALRRPRSWAGELRVAQIVKETPTIETFRLVEPSLDRLPFDFLPGQFLQIEIALEAGKAARRSYTIASSPTQRAYAEIAIKREEHGIVSQFLHDRVKVGDLVKASGPFGAFTFTGSDADSIVLIAGGVGITPMMSVLRYLTDTAWPGEIFFLYGARSTEEFVFRDEIERLERRHERLHVLATMQRSPGTVWLGPEGVLTGDLLQAAVPQIGRRRIHLCGPPGMMSAVKRLLGDLGVPDAQIHSEAFGPASLPAENAPEALTSSPEEAVAPTPARSAERKSDKVAETTVTFSLSGISAALASDETVLEAAEGAGVEIPYACRVGQCGVCVTKLVQGTVTMEVETGLDPADKTQGYVLACQAKSSGIPLVVEA